MVDMKMDPEARKEYSQPAIAYEQPKYPYGLQITLDTESLKKLGYKDLPEVGTILTLKAKVEVCSTSLNERADSEPCMCMGLQITDMELGAGKKDAAKVLYEDK